MKRKGKVFILDDDDLITSMVARALEKEGHRVKAAVTPEGLLETLEAWSPDVLLMDIHLPGIDGLSLLKEISRRGLSVRVVMLTADDRAGTAVQAMKLGAADYITKPFHMDEVRIVVRNILERERMRAELGYFRRMCAGEASVEILGESAALRALTAELEQLAAARVNTVLITGESGTGKEVFAKNFHRLLDREGSMPFIRVNCAALPENLLESELFGHERGAFTDAKTEKKGLFELADGGCLLLDEIGEMHPALQGKLLRVLEEREMRRVGGEEDIPVDVRVIATTNRDLQPAVEEGTFRLDLFYRLNAFHLRIPPLRERPEDVPPLARHFLARFSARYNKPRIRDFAPEALRLLQAYAWPGNIRELKNVVERLVVLKDTESIQPEHLPREILGEAAPGAASPPGAFVLPPDGIRLEDLERDLLEQALRRTGGNRAQAARLLGIGYDSLRYRLKKFGITPG
ncbi:sigma-54-dependent Fis family transcriptional regulator [Dissulfurirhabdus thermomarina]|uniref:Sigma-54-dependent Fis family transcriptional regulator n=1 Tax=Dissulfurirhabdus thermomarina TaxID=1765737 RepID=A0A6N9TWK2_DISTH|nr:sigma-54 dependent transcriptional regulator [Dissulfurirhabdus thermomarina]NDY42866.1 sigma-54-dependent Fis family transcriptional regulator [Dissulfurirhabdus thermomarina]NMX24436.1 sigma-54-dependent Fis family transcriptional regulator [Dissulfurirhabdus thermomarina]